MLEGFKRYDITVGTISVSITDNGISFSKAAIVRMGKPEYVIFMIDEENKRIAIQKSEKDEEGAIKFYSEKNVISVRWNNKELLKTISQMMDWQLTGNIYRADGDYISSEVAIIFDLKKAEKSSSK